MELKYEIVLYS